ncbi:hypothetical protein ACWEGM_19070, partial [Streptomyces nigra]
MLRRKARRGQGGGAVRDVDVLDDPLDAAQERRVRAVLALGGVPQADLPDGVQQVRLRLLERAAGGQEAPRDVSACQKVIVVRAFGSSFAPASDEPVQAVASSA